MVSLTRSKAVLELGSRLVAQLGTEDDFLASWMSHYIAELIEACKTASEEDKSTAQQACAQAILDLWRHRASLPAHLRPFTELEPIVRALTALDVGKTDYGYHAQTFRRLEGAQPDEETQKWLDFASGIDYSARLLIEVALRAAADRPASTAEAWLDLATEAGIEDGLEHHVVKFVRRESLEAESDQDRHRRRLEERLTRLDSFIRVATALADDLRAELAENAVETASAADSTSTSANTEGPSSAAVPPDAAEVTTPTETGQDQELTNVATAASVDKQPHDSPKAAGEVGPSSAVVPSDADEVTTSTGTGQDQELTNVATTTVDKQPHDSPNSAGEAETTEKAAQNQDE